jgi:hypothetical protein
MPSEVNEVLLSILTTTRSDIRIGNILRIRANLGRPYFVLREDILGRGSSSETVQYSTPENNIPCLQDH